MKEINAVIVNNQTLEFLPQVVISVIASYPDVKTLIFDNGTQDHSKFGYKLGLKGKIDYLINRLRI